MKSKKSFFVLLNLITNASVSYASTDLASGAKTLQTKLEAVGATILIIFVMIAAIYMNSGSQEGSRKMSAAILGIICFFGASAIVAFFKFLK
ncbi:MAG: TrbC/VirB2 family protein [Bacteriovorax sp.]|nr:TrbC/VirB2 family protein [Bacteriovorax sp.]